MRLGENVRNTVGELLSVFIGVSGRTTRVEQKKPMEIIMIIAIAAPTVNFTSSICRSRARARAHYYLVNNVTTISG